MTNGYISDAGGVTFSSVSETHQIICGTIFAINNNAIKIWAMSDYVACARDGWGSEEIGDTSGTLHIQAWLLDSCKKKFSRTFMMDKDNINTMFPTVDNVQFDSPYSLTSTIVSVQMKVFTPNNAGFVFYAGGSAMIDKSQDPYGAIIYGYTETEVFLWRPDKDTSNVFLVYVGGEWGNGESSQQASIVEVTVKVIEIDDCPIPDDIPNAHKLHTGLTNGSTTMYACMQGYASSSYNSVIHCISGVWSSSDMNCNVVCPSPPGITNAEVTVENNTARYFCNPGYYQLENTDDFISCRGNIWQPTNFECIQICGAPPTIANTEVMRFNNRAMYSCREGYRSMSGSNRINCTMSVWQTTTFSCYAISCGLAPNITNADVLVNDDGAMYACHYGFSPSNINNRLLCQAGSWSLTDFQCLDASGSVGSIIDNKTLQRWIKQIKHDLLIDKKTTNAYLRTLSSVYDPRPVSIAIGGSGVALLCIAILIIVLPDVLRICKYVFGKIPKVTKLNPEIGEIF